MRYVAAVVIVGLLALAAWQFAGYAATYGTAVAQAGAPISLGEQVVIASGNFIARYFVFLVAGMLVVAILVARALGGSAEDGKA